MRATALLYSSSYNDHALDEAAERGERCAKWRVVRQFALECGEDVEALIEPVADEDLGELVITCLATMFDPDIDRRLLKQREITERLIARTLDHEAQRGDYDR